MDLNRIQQAGESYACLSAILRGFWSIFSAPSFTVTEYVLTLTWGAEAADFVATAPLRSEARGERTCPPLKVARPEFMK